MAEPATLAEALAYVVKWGDSAMEKPGYYGVNFLEDFTGVIEYLRKISAAGNSVSVDQFKTIFEMGYRSAEQSIPFDKALADRLGLIKEIDLS